MCNLNDIMTDNVKDVQVLNYIQYNPSRDFWI